MTASSVFDFQALRFHMYWSKHTTTELEAKDFHGFTAASGFPDFVEILLKWTDFVQKLHCLNAAVTTP